MHQTSIAKDARIVNLHDRETDAAYWRISSPSGTILKTYIGVNA
jgi:hypothetical protein